jgi:hypothetical protein
VKSKHEWSQPKAASGYPAAAEVTDHYANARHTIHLADHRNSLDFRKMMKELW